MSDDDKRALFGRQGDADQLMAQATGKVEGQKMSPERLEQARKQQLAQATTLDTQASAEFTEEIITYLNEMWNARNFTPEQRIFSIALATVNLREQVPPEFPDGTPGGKDMFDRVCRAAREYYDKNKD